jgi:hypothetical protein
MDTAMPEEALSVAQKQPPSGAKDEEGRDIDEIGDVGNAQTVQDGIGHRQAGKEDKGPASPHRLTVDEPAQPEHLHDKRKQIELVGDE